LWKIYRRPDWNQPLTEAKNLPWNDPNFSERMLREHLDSAWTITLVALNEQCKSTGCGEVGPQPGSSC
jgi:hypothetical protein